MSKTQTSPHVITNRGTNRTARGTEGRVRGSAEADGGDDGDHAKSWASIGCTCAVFSSSTSYSYSYSCKYKSPLFTCLCMYVGLRAVVDVGLRAVLDVSLRAVVFAGFVNLPVQGRCCQNF